MNMGNPFQILGPFTFDGEKIADKEYQKTFWCELDEEHPQLSEANGLYLLSLRIGSNYDPNYVGMTKREFRKEVFNPPNVVKILNDFVPKRGELCVHLLAKPRDSDVGFAAISKKTLLWTEMFLLMLCRKKNPEILNIVGHAFLENCAMEGITSPVKGKSNSIRTEPLDVPQPRPILHDARALEGNMIQTGSCRTQSTSTVVAGQLRTNRRDKILASPYA
jgi:hypothetical protein